MHRRSALPFAVIITALLLIFDVASAQADPRPEFDQDVARVGIVDAISGNEEYGIPENLSPDEIEVSRIVKVYIDTNIFAHEADDFDGLTEALEAAGYVYAVYFLIDGKLFDADMSVGEMPSEETVQRIRESEGEYAEQIIAGAMENAGKWHVARYGMHESSTDPDYLDIATEASGITDREPIFVGGLPHIHYPVALYPDDGGKIDVMVPLSPASFPWEKLGMDRPEEPVALDYAMVKEAIDSLPPEGIDDELADTVPEDRGSGEPASASTAGPSAPLPSDDAEQTPSQSPDGSPMPWAVFAGMVLAGAIVAAVVIRRRRAVKRRSNGDDSPRLT
jgi:hypothetical protein